ncbi:MAG: right-handed parallel beta-helix repeat-containing protein [Opitutaceae bacterium]|nr:right-handed parallel beta-helix repeat-containing protein [Opitutaceae bacterium]
MSAFPFSAFLLMAVAFSAASHAADVISAGAKGDGSTDDTAAIQRAVNAGSTVHFPAGRYRLTRTVTIALEQTGFVALTADGTARIIMAGAGPAFEFVGTHGGSAAPEQFKPNVWERQRTPRVDGLEIVGAHPEADGVAAKGTMQFTLTNLVVREARHAVRLYDRNRNVMISDCHLYHNRGIGIFLDAVNQHQTNITGSHISYNAGGGVVVRGGNVRNIHIGNCDIESNMAAGAPATANVLLDSTGGSVGEVAITGCTIQHTVNGPDSANIRVLGRGTNPATARAAATTTQEGHVTITGNVLSDVQVNIHLQHARGVTITGNTFWMGFQHDILVEDSSHVVVGPNNLDRNPRYDSQARTSRGGVLFRRSGDCTLTGLHISGVHGQPAAVQLEECARFNLSGLSILDSDGVGLALKNTSLTRVGGCVIRDDRAEPNRAAALLVSGGAGNHISGNVLDRRAEIAAGAAIARDNDVVSRAGGAGATNR